LFFSLRESATFKKSQAGEIFPDDGKQPKTFGLNFIILQLLAF